MTRRRVDRPWRPVAVALVLMLMTVVPTSPAESDVEPTELEWWGETTVGEGFHIRFPVTVENPHDYPVTGGVATAEIDVAQILVEEGWVSEPRSGADLLRSFALDNSSVRVVAMHNLLPMSSHSATDGRLGLYSSVFPPGDLRRHEVPSTYFTGALSGTLEFPFDRHTNPFVTVMWRVQETLEPAAEAYYMVYLDSTTNRVEPHEDPDYSDVPGGALLDRTFWSGPGTDLVGVVVPDASKAGAIQVIGVHDDTAVTVLVGDMASGKFREQAPGQTTHDNPFTIGRGEYRQVMISQSEPRPFRLLATKPILAVGDSEGFVPSTQGDTVGDEFLFSTTYLATGDAAVDQDSLFFYNMNPNSAETEVQLERWADGQVESTQTVHLSNGDNFLPYTVGARGSPGDSCTFEQTPDMAVIAPGRGDYRAVVTEGGPVAVQIQPRAGATQVPAVTGAPHGTAFWSALSRVVNCGDLHQYSAFVTAAEPTPLSLSNPEWCPVESWPCGEGWTAGPFPDAILSQTFRTGDLFERPIRFETGAPSSLLIMPEDQVSSLARVPLRGPLGGADAGRDFVGYGSEGGPPLLYAPFSDTKVDAHIHYASTGSGAPSERRISLVGEQLDDLPTREGDPILSYRLEASRPILVVPQGASSGFLAGLPPTLATTVHPGDYRGHMVEIRSITGLDPVSASTVADKPVTYDFVVTNRGRGVGGSNLPDNINLHHSAPPEGWTATLSRKSISLASGDSASVRLTVDPGPDAEPGTLGPITVFAVSDRNDQAEHSADTVTHIKSAYGVGIWFNDAEVGPKGAKDSGDAGEPVNYTVIVGNTGSVPDTIALDFTPPEGGWDVLLLRHGNPVTELSLAAGGTATLKLQVTSPAEATQGLLLTSVSARSTSSPAVVDRIFAQTSIHAPSDLSLEVEQATQWVDPGEEAVFNLTLRNDGGATEVFFDLRGDLLPGWTEPAVFLRHLHSGERIHLDRVSIGFGETIRLAAAINASAFATTGDRVSIRALFNAAGSGPSVGDFLHAVVRPIHDIVIEPPDLPLLVSRGGTTVPIEVRVTNNGSMDETVRPTTAFLPAGWDLSCDAADVLLLRNETQGLSCEIVVASEVAKGEYMVALSVVSEDGAYEEVELPVLVGTFANHVLDGGEVVAGQPGRTAWTTYSATNGGNTPLEVRIEEADDEVWELVAPPVGTELPPGASIKFRVGWRVPLDAADGQSQHTASVVLIPESADTETIRDAVIADIEVGRPELRVTAAAGFKAPAGQVVRAVLANEGSRSAHDVVVALLVDGERVDGVTMQEIPAGGLRNVTLLQPAGRPGPATVVVDAAGVNPESDRSDNVMSVAAAEDPPTTPGPGFLVLLAGFVPAAFAAGRKGRAKGRAGHPMAGNHLKRGTSRTCGSCVVGGGMRGEGSEEVVP